MKFGGTSLGSPERMKHVAQLACSLEEQVIVVLSAVSGTTNALVEIAGHIKEKKMVIPDLIVSLRAKYELYVESLFETTKGKTLGNTHVADCLSTLEFLASRDYTDQLGKEIVVIGELISTGLFKLLLDEIQVPAMMLMAHDFMCISEEREPDIPRIRSILNDSLKEEASQVIVTQGFICRSSDGKIDNLQRGGSDYSATIIGAALHAEEVQIWTDIDGMHNNDPRVVDKTIPISELSFEEASELAYFGAKILHPYCIIPAQKFSVPVRIKNTMQPEAAGTYISAKQDHENIKAIAAKDRITAIKVKSSRMINAYGFLRKVFEVFERFKTPIDMITTSEIAVSLTIDDPTYLDDILEELQDYGKVEVDHGQTIICIVGDLVAENTGVGKVIFTALEKIPIRMVSYGGSRNNISVLVDTAHKSETLKNLNKVLFNL